MSAIPRRAHGTWAPVLAAAVASAALLATTLFIHRGVRDASDLVARGLGEAFAVSGRETLGGEAFPPSAETLQRFLDRHAEDGLRHVAIVADDGTVIVSAGQALGTGIQDDLVMVGERARLVHRLRLRRPPAPPADPPSPGQEEGREGTRRRRLPRVVYEFEPLAALELEQRSWGLLFVAGVCGLGILGLAVALSRSLRQRERLHEELEHGRRLASLGSMSAVLAHELRNPLASLKGHAQLLAEMVEGDARLGPKVDRVVSEAVRLERLMNDLLTFVRSGELRRSPTDPSALLRAAVQAVGADAIEARYLAQPVHLSLDAERLQQALENVLRNALQASPPGEKIHAEVARADGHVLFTVRDRGPGISPGEEERIFEPFVTGRVRGVGLGLAITRRIVELHGGQIAARNLPGGGAEFRIRVPGEEV